MKLSLILSTIIVSFFFNEGLAQSLRINCGGGSLTTNSGINFASDNFFLDGQTFSNSSIIDILGTDDDELYITERSSGVSSGTINYKIPLPPNTYVINLHFAEIYFGATSGGTGGSGKRVFDVMVEDSLFLQDLDIYDEVGPMVALTKSLFIPVTDDTLNIFLQASINQPKISAIEVIGTVAEEIVASPPELNFTPLDASSVADTLRVVLTNTVADTIIIQGTNIIGTDAFDFLVINLLDSILTVGESIQVTIVHLPSSLGIKNAKLRVFHSGTASPLIIPMNGQGVVEASCSWVLGDTTYQPTVESMSVVWDGKFYTMGGFINFLDGSDVFEVYDPVLNTWTLLSPMPKEITHHAAIAYNDQIWSIAGFEGDNPGTAISEVMIYDIASDTWSYGPSIQEARGSVTATLNGRKIHLIGGLLPDRETDVAEHYILDLDDTSSGWTAAAPLPEALNHMSSATVKGKVYSIGGQKGHDGPRFYKKYLYVYDPQTDSWEQLSDLPTDRSHFEPGTFVKDGKIYIVGGRNNTSYYGNVLVYDPNLDTWQEYCELPANLMSVPSKAIDNVFIVAQGGEDGASNPLNTTHVSVLNSNPIFELGFWPDSLSINLEEDSTAVLETVLWTVSGETAYTIDTASLPAWLQLSNAEGNTKTSGEDIEITFNPSGISPGNYSSIITASAAGYADAQLEVFLIVDPCTLCLQCGEEVTGLMADILSPTQARLSWNPVEFATDYGISGRQAGSGTFANGIVNDTNKIISVLSPGTLYEWTVRAKCLDGSISPPSSLDSFETPILRTTSEQAISFELHPNPVNTDILNLQINGLDNSALKLELVDLFGKIYPTEVIEGRNSKSIQLNISHLKQGYYILKLNNGSDQWNRSFIRQ